MGHQKHEDKLPLVKQEVEKYLANLKQQLQTLLQTFYADPANKTTSVTITHQRESKARTLVECTLQTPDKFKYILPLSSDTLCDLISSRISSLNGIGSEIAYDRRFRLHGTFMNNYTGYDSAHFRTTDLERVDLQFAQSGIALLTQSPTYAPKAQRLLIRLSAISKLSEDLEKADAQINLKNKVEAAITTCKANKPSWSEQPFLDKLKDIFSLGIRYMFFHHNETKVFKEKVEPLLPSPGPEK